MKKVTIQVTKKVSYKTEMSVPDAFDSWSLEAKNEFISHILECFPEKVLIRGNNKSEVKITAEVYGSSTRNPNSSEASAVSRLLDIDEDDVKVEHKPDPKKWEL